MSHKSKSNYQAPIQCKNPQDAPEFLDDNIFYDLKLDDEQKVFRDLIYDKNKVIVVCNSKAGTGKTTISLGVANILYSYGFYNGITYIMSPSQEQRQGYLPGDMHEKNAPYMEPLLEAMHTLGINDIYLKEDIENEKQGAYINFTVDTYLRGCNFEKQVVIIDEAQNFTFDDLKKTLTRIHDNCKVILIGHTEQCDLCGSKRSGFDIYLNAFEKEKDNPKVGLCRLSINHRGWLSTFCDNVMG